MASATHVYNDIDEILGVVLESDGSDIDLGEDKELDNQKLHTTHHHTPRLEPG